MKKWILRSRTDSNGSPVCFIADFSLRFISMAVRVGGVAQAVADQLNASTAMITTTPGISSQGACATV